MTNKDTPPNAAYDFQLEQRVMQMTDAMLIMRKKENQAADAFLSSISKFTLAQLTVLNTIGEYQPCTMTEIATQAKLAMSTITSVLNKLVKLEYVIRYRSEQDRRIVLAKLTPEGNKIVYKQLELLHNSCRDLLKSLNLEEQANLLHYLDRYAKST